jgi:hypothetical protein
MPKNLYWNLIFLLSCRLALPKHTEATFAKHWRIFRKRPLNVLSCKVTEFCINWNSFTSTTLVLGDWPPASYYQLITFLNKQMNPGRHISRLGRPQTVLRPTGALGWRGKDRVVTGARRRRGRGFGEVAVCGGWKWGRSRRGLREPVGGGA